MRANLKREDRGAPVREDAFDSMAETYDDTFSNSRIGRLQRAAVWTETERTFRRGQRVLEINCGTGIDAIHLGELGIDVVACDSSPRMIEVARRRLEHADIPGSIDFRCVSIQRVSLLAAAGPYDGVFSNFAGLNCIPDIASAARDLARLVKPGGNVVLCLFGRTCIWEIFSYLLRGKIRKAFRRLNPRGTIAHLGPGSTVHVHYHPVRRLREAFAPDFRMRGLKGVGIAVPPSYLERLAARMPRILKLAGAIDPWLGRCPGIRALADHVVLTFEKRAA